MTHGRESRSAAHDGLSSSALNIRGSTVSDFQVTTSSLDDLEEKTRHIIVDHRLVPATRGRHADGEFRLHALSDIGVFNIRYGRKLVVDFHPDEINRSLAVVMANKGTGLLRMGQEELAVSGQQSVIFSSGTPRALHYDEDCETLAIIMNYRKIVDHCSKLLGRELAEHVTFDPAFLLGTASGQSWLRLVEYASNELTQPQSLVRHSPLAQQQLEQMMMTGLLLSQSHTYSEALLQPQAAAAPYYVKRAEAYIEAHYADPLSLADIASYAGVSARSLQNGFQNFRNMTPMAFLRTVRLQHAHRALLGADPVASTVTEIAMSCGFSHMGEFAALYKRTFGVTPSQTLLKMTQR